MANYLTTDTDLTAVADAIRTKGGTSARLAFPVGFVNAIDSIETGGGWTDYLAQIFDQTITEYTYDTPNVRTIDYNANSLFRGCTHLEYFHFPYVTTISNCSGMFYGCTGLTKISADMLPKLKTLTNCPQFFYQCTNLICAVLPAFNSTSQNSIFAFCSNLEVVDLSGASVTGTGNMLNQQFFLSCSKLETIIIRKNSVAPCGNINNFQGTPFASDGTGGTLYVPSALISAYESATNWSTILGYANNQILPIEGSEYENAYADGTPIT